MLYNNSRTIKIVVLENAYNAKCCSQEKKNGSNMKSCQKPAVQLVYSPRLTCDGLADPMNTVAI